MGCNAGGQLYQKKNYILDNKANLRDTKGSFAQNFAVKIGKDSVYAAVSKGFKGGSVYKRDAQRRAYCYDG